MRLLPWTLVEGCCCWVVLDIAFPHDCRGTLLIDLACCMFGTIRLMYPSSAEAKPALGGSGVDTGSTLFAHGGFVSKCDLVLASQSPRRLEIVGMMGLAVSDPFDRSMQSSRVELHSICVLRIPSRPHQRLGYQPLRGRAGHFLQYQK